MASVVSSTSSIAVGQRPSARAKNTTSFRALSLSSKSSVAPTLASLKRRSALQTGLAAAGSRSALRISAKKTQWPKAFEYLEDAKLKSVPPKEAQKLMKRGWVLVDVRPNDLFEESRAAGSKNAALYRTIDPKSALQWARFVLYKSMEVKPVEENPDFIEDAEAVIGRAKGVIVACAEGGTLEPTYPSFPTGKTSRSLVAAYLLLEEGTVQSKRVVHLQGGLNAWFRADLPGDGEEEWTFDARTPSEAPPAKYSAAYNARGEKAEKDRTAFRERKVGTMLQDGGNALDPFGTWSVLLKKKDKE